MAKTHYSVTEALNVGLTHTWDREPAGTATVASPYWLALDPSVNIITVNTNRTILFEFALMQVDGYLSTDDSLRLNTNDTATLVVPRGVTPFNMNFGCRPTSGTATVRIVKG